jgi:hypothetical protein
MTSSRIIALVVFWMLWSASLCYVRMIAAKEKAGPGRPWGGHFIWTGWRKPGTARGKKYVDMFNLLLALGFALFLVVMMP